MSRKGYYCTAGGGVLARFIAAARGCILSVLAALKKALRFQVSEFKVARKIWSGPENPGNERAARTALLFAA